MALQHRQRSGLRADVGVMHNRIFLCRDVIHHGPGPRVGRRFLDADVAARPQQTSDRRVVQRYKALSRRDGQGRERRHDVVTQLEAFNAPSQAQAAPAGARLT